MTATTTEPTRDNYLPDVAVSAIIKHPHNPRHRATADAELVESVKNQGLVQPLIVAPHPDKVDKYILIAGHRRLDALKKNKTRTTQAVVRHDLRSEGQQLEAMLVENGRRKDLTPIEEAEGYAQLELLGYKATAIATAMGRDVKTVRARLRLLKLSPATRTKVHGGQLTIEDAAAIVEFAEDPETTKKLESAARGDDFKYQLQAARRRRNQAREAAVLLTKLLDAGATELVLESGTRFWSVRDRDTGPTELTYTFSPDWGQHKDCLGVVTETDQYTGPQTYALCMDPASHTDKLDEAERKRREENARLQQEHEAEMAAHDDAQTVRMQTLIDLVGTNTAMPPQLRDLVRALVPATIVELNGRALKAYQQAMNIPEDARWEHVSGHQDDTKPSVEARLLRDHLDDVQIYSDGILTRVLLAVLAAAADLNLRTTYGRRDHMAGEYLDLLAEAGHPFCEVDRKLRDEVTGVKGDAEVEVA